MGKILEFNSARKQVKKHYDASEPNIEADDSISAILNDHSLTVANRHWLLENLLMNIDEQLEAYRKELDRAESRLDTLVKSAEKEIASAYREFNAHLGVMTHAVRKLTVAPPRGGRPEHPDSAADPRVPSH